MQAQAQGRGVESLSESRALFIVSLLNFKFLASASKRSNSRRIMLADCLECTLRARDLIFARIPAR